MSNSTTTETLGFEAFCDIGAAWNEMVLASDAATPFVSHQWIRTWWRHFGDGADFFAPIVRSGESLVAGVPLATRRSRLGGLPITVAEIVGTAPVPTRGMGLADRADLVVRRDTPDAAPTLAAAVLAGLDDADALDLKGLDDGSITMAALRRDAPRPAAVRVLPRSTSPYIALPGTFDAYLRSRSRNFRSNLKKRRRQLAERGAIEHVRWTPDDDLAAWIEDLRTVNRASWKAERGTDLLRHPAIDAFMVDLLTELAAADMLDLHLLRLDGRPIAHDLCFDFAGAIQSYNHGYDQAFRRFSPGTVVTVGSIESAITRGRREYDLLRGDDDYKSQWSETSRTELQLIVPAASLRAATYGRIAAAKSRLKRRRWLIELDDRITGLRARSPF